PHQLPNRHMRHPPTLPGTGNLESDHAHLAVRRSVDIPRSPHLPPALPPAELSRSPRGNFDTMTPATDNPAALLAWYAAMGVDEAVDDAPVDRFAQSLRQAAVPAPAPRAQSEQAPAAEPAQAPARAPRSLAERPRPAAARPAPVRPAPAPL